jgi:hypothetical protein
LQKRKAGDESPARLSKFVATQLRRDNAFDDREDNQQRKQHQRFDQRQTKNHHRLDTTRCARVTRRAFARRSTDARLSESAAKTIPAAIALYLLTEYTLSPASAPACANTLMLLARIPITANSNILSLLMLPPLIRFNSSFRANRDGIISPASGIHRPSYNGAPAKQTGLAMSVSACLVSFEMCSNVCGRIARIAHRTL